MKESTHGPSEGIRSAAGIVPCHSVPLPSLPALPVAAVDLSDGTAPLVVQEAQSLDAQT